MPGGAGQRGRGRAGQEHRGLTAVTVGGAGDAADAHIALATGGDHVQALADVDAEPRVGDGLAGGLRGMPGLQRVRGEGGAVPRVGVEVAATHAMSGRVEGAGRKREVADGARDTRHRGHAGGQVTGQARSRDDVDRVDAAAGLDRGIGAHDGVGRPEAPGTGRGEGTGHQLAGGVGERDRQEDRHEGPGEGPAAGAEGLEGDAQHRSVPQPGQALGDGLGARGQHLAGEPAVGHEHDAVGPGGGRRVVGDHDQRPAALVDRVAQQAEHLA